MAHNIISEAELEMLLAANPRQDEMKQPRRLRLTMKYLYHLIGEIQHDKRMLTARVDELEQQLYVLFQIQEVEASAHEMLSTEEAQVNKDAEYTSTISDPIEIPRSLRHPKPEKTSFIDFLFRR